MELNLQTVLMGLLYHFVHIQITGALFFGLNSNSNRVANDKRHFEKSHTPLFLHHPTKKQLTSDGLGSYAKRKRFFEYNPVAFQSEYGDFKNGRNTKRFFHFSPFITSFNNDRKSWTPKVKQNHEHRKMFVDHFNGILPSSLHTSNKKITNNLLNNNGFRRTGSQGFENNISGLLYEENKQISDDSGIFYKNEVEPLSTSGLEIGENEVQTTTPTSVSEPFDNIPFDWLKGKLEAKSNTRSAKEPETMAINSFETPDFPSSDLDKDGGFDKYSLDWLNNKLAAQSDTNPSSEGNVFDQKDSIIYSNQHGDTDFTYMNSDLPYKQNNDDRFKQSKAYVQLPNHNQIGIGTIELRNHDSIHSGFDTFKPFEVIPEPSEFVNPINMEADFQATDGHPLESFFKNFDDYDERSVYQEDEGIPQWSSGIHDVGTFLQRDELIKPHVGRGSFISDNSHCEDIDSRTCSGSRDCSCYGMYTCSDMRCVSFESILSEAYQPAEVPEENGQWFDTPFDSWTK